jgi:replication-associated recombination protein RarA
MSGIATRVRQVSTALYRRYRPETFADVIGQEHVTEPLMQALRTGGSTTPTCSAGLVGAARRRARGSSPAA